MRLQHTVFPAEVPLAEAAVAYNRLRAVLAVLEGAADLLRCAAAYRKSHVERAFACDVVGGERLGEAEMLAGVDDAELAFGDVGAEGQQAAEVGDSR